MDTVHPRPKALFHTIVVVGASLGCGGRPPTRGFPVVDAGSSTDWGDAASRPAGVCDCEWPGDFRCEHCRSGIGPILGRCPEGDGVGCTCLHSIEFATPRDCEHPEQFVCAGPPSIGADAGLFWTVSGWFDFAECSCDPTRPIQASDCDARLGEVFRCEQNPCPFTPGYGNDVVQYACACVIPPPIAIAQ